MKISRSSVLSLSEFMAGWIDNPCCSENWVGGFGLYGWWGQWTSYVSNQSTSSFHIRN